MYIWTRYKAEVIHHIVKLVQADMIDITPDMSLQIVVDGGFHGLSIPHMVR